MPKIFVLALALLALPSVAAKPVYQLKDLVALEKTKGWEELVQHLSDILPSERGDQWKALVTKALTERLSELMNQTDSNKTIEFLDTALSAYPFIKSNKPFMENRGIAGLAHYSSCFIHINIPLTK